ncbi:hypothetical protein ACWGJB_18615 [Streptomyces sp. NPDC054813]
MVVFHDSLGTAPGRSGPRVIGAFVLAALLLPAFVLRDRATAQPVMDLAPGR